MAWNGYWEYDGVEIINAARVEQYVADRPWFIPTFNHHDFHVLLEDAPYVSPVADDAPWYDPDNEASGEFFGFYPLDVAGAESSSRGATPSEFTTDGGTVGRLRHNMKTVVFNGLLMASTERGAEYGAMWLRRATRGASCDPGEALELGLGKTLTFFSARPETTGAESGIVVPRDEFEIDGTEWLRPVLRHFLAATIAQGPTITQKMKMSCGGHVWSAQFTATVGNTYEYGMPRALLAGYLHPSTTNPWIPGTAAGTADAVSHGHADVECGSDVWEPIYDPLCPALVPPPQPPSVPLGCYVPETTWSRYTVRVPGANIPEWSEVVPTLTVQSLGEESRNVRIRFYPDPEGVFDPDDDPCDHVADAVLSYIPAGGTMIVDGATKSVYVVTNLGHRRRADSLVFSSDGAPFRWPSFSCGFPYVMTIDLPVGDTAPAIDLTLTPRSR